MKSIWTATLFSKNTSAKRDDLIRESYNNCCIQRNLAVVAGKAQYSTSIDEQKLVDHFFPFQEIRESPKNISNLVIDFENQNKKSNPHSRMLESLKDIELKKKPLTKGRLNILN